MICRAIPYEGKEPYIFLSYCHGDSDQLYPLFEQLVSDGYRVWYDDGNHAGDDWMENIETHLEDCNAMVAFISENSSLSHNCKSEIVYGLMCKKKVLPVLIDTAQLPKGLRMQLSHLHFVKRSDFPNDKALIAKIAETAEIADCKGPAGSLPMRDVGSQQKKESDKPVSGTGSFFSNLTEKKEEPKQEKPVKPAEPEKEPPVEEKPSEPESGKKKPSEKKTPKIIKILVKQKKAKDAEPEQPAAKEPEKKKPEYVEDPIEEKTVYDAKTVFDDMEKTVYANGDDATIRERYDDDDDDRTVVIRHLPPALLLQLSNAKAFPLTMPQTKLGRSPFRADVVIEGNDSISKHHADIIREKEKFFLRDTGSANGTSVGGQELKAEEKTELTLPALFRLNDESFLLIGGADAQKLLKAKSAALLLNESMTGVKVLGQEDLLLNRYHKWEDGTLNDKKVHREAHALVRPAEDGYALVDESPSGGNGTFLNEKRLKLGETRTLKPGDVIRVGDTKLEYVSITF